jgi:hypothetical protein
MSEEFLRTSINGEEFIVMSNITTSADKRQQKMIFTTDIDGREHSLMVTLTSDAVALQEVSGIDVQAEMMRLMEVELAAEIQGIVDKPV